MFLCQMNGRWMGVSWMGRIWLVDVEECFLPLSLLRVSSLYPFTPITVASRNNNLSTYCDKSLNCNGEVLVSVYIAAERLMIGHLVFAKT